MITSHIVFAESVRIDIFTALECTRFSNANLDIVLHTWYFWVNVKHCPVSLSGASVSTVATK
jgi:hypothetical protein